MPKKILSINDIRGNAALGTPEYFDVYSKLLTSQNLSQEDKIAILRIIAYFMYAGDSEIHKMAYAMALWYGDSTGDYEPVLDIAAQLRYYPVVKLIESRMGAVNNANEDSTETRHGSSIADMVLNDALAEVYKEDSYYKTEQQYRLGRAVRTEKNVTAIAPTSYGKSDMLLEKVLQCYKRGQNVCILVPTKSLLVQTLRQLIKKKGDRRGIIIHPDMPIMSKHLITIFTQERLANFQIQYPKKIFNYIFVDEAHNLMEYNDRSLALSRCLIIAKARNKDVNIDFFSPFVVNPKESLDLICVNDVVIERNTHVVKEYMKIPKYLVFDGESGKLIRYDQFTEAQVLLENGCRDCYKFIADNAGEKNIVYVNTPEQAERFAHDLAAKVPLAEYDEDEQRIIDELCDTLSESVHQSYSLINLVRHGIIISHGKMLDNIKEYTETLYGQLKHIQYVVTTSTLLEGVNLPADKLFLLNFYKGRSNLSYSAFHNLVGRVARYNRVFNSDAQNISLLTPEIYFIKGDFLNKRSPDPIKFLSTNAREGVSKKDDIKNPLLVSYIGEKCRERYGQATSMANIDRSNVSLYRKTFNADVSLAETEVGQLMYENNIPFGDITRKEKRIQEYCTKWKNSINDGLSAMNAIYQLFLSPAYYDVEIGKSWLYSLYASDGKRKVYAQIVDDRIDGKKLGSIVGGTVASWERKIGESVYVGSIGDVNKRGDREKGWNFEYHIFSKEDKSLMPSYALALLKENFDHLDYYILPFFEIMRSLEMISDSFYLKVKYGTDDDNIIELIKMGFDISLALSISEDKELVENMKQYSLGNEKVTRDSLIAALKNKNLSHMELNAIENII